MSFLALPSRLRELAGSWFRFRSIFFFRLTPQPGHDYSRNRRVFFFEKSASAISAVCCFFTMAGWRRINTECEMRQRYRLHLR